MINKRLEQKLLGAGILILCGFIWLLCQDAPGDDNAGGLVLLVPLGLYLLGTKDQVV